MLKGVLGKLFRKENKSVDISSLINYNPFFDHYKQGDIVYPNAIARHFSISQKEAYKKCEDMKKNGKIRSLYMITCPVCGNTATSYRYYALEHINTDEEVYCNNCDYEFFPKIDTDVEALYEKR